MKNKNRQTSEHRTEPNSKPNLRTKPEPLGWVERERNRAPAVKGSFPFVNLGQSLILAWLYHPVYFHIIALWQQAKRARCCDGSDGVLLIDSEYADMSLCTIVAIL